MFRIDWPDGEWFEVIGPFRGRWLLRLYARLTGGKVVETRLQRPLPDLSTGK